MLIAAVASPIRFYGDERAPLTPPLEFFG